jgi:hypothetical protein
MKRVDVRKRARSRSVALVMGVVAIVVGVVAATAQATPNKPYTANVHQTLNTPGSFTLTVSNDPHASQTLGSANFTPPAGFVLGAVTAGSIGGSDAAGFNVNIVGNVVQFRAISSATALPAGGTVSADVTVTSGIVGGCASATWAVEAKQSNSFSGTPGNDLQLNPASDLTPLGSLAFAAPVESGPPTYPVEVPQIVTGAAAPVSIKAYDTCGNPDADYTGATLNTESGYGLDPSDFSILTWSTNPVDGSRVGSGTVTPKVVETGDQFTVDDGPSGISAMSYSTGTQPTFDVVQKICAMPGTACQWKDPGNSGINASSTVPSGAPHNASLGLGYRGFANGVTCTPTGGSPLSPLPGTDSIQIDPYSYGNTPYTIVITYAKALVGNGPASNFIACKSTDVGSQLLNWSPLAACSNSVTVDCVSVAKISGGAIQVTLNLRPGDPGSGGFKGG